MRRCMSWTGVKASSVGRMQAIYQPVVGVFCLKPCLIPDVNAAGALTDEAVTTMAFVGSDGHRRARAPLPLRANQRGYAAYA